MGSSRRFSASDPKRVEEIVEATPAEILIGVAGRAAALPGLLAALTTRPVIGVPVGHTVPFDSLLSIVQMPPGITVATVGVDRGDNAALLTAGILGVKDHDILAASTSIVETNSKRSSPRTQASEPSSACRRGSR